MQPMPFNAISLDGIKGVLIDLDDTLYAYEPAHQTAMKETYKFYPHTYSFEDFSTSYRDARNAILKRLEPQAACRSRFFAFQDMAKDWGLPCSYVLAAEWEKKYWDSLVDAMVPDPNAIAFLKRCRDAKIQVCIVSDMTAVFQVQKLKKLGVEGLVDYLVTSEEVGAEKPDPRMFQMGLKKLNLSAQDVVMIGDNEKKDIAGAAALGIKTILVKAGGDL